MYSSMVEKGMDHCSGLVDPQITGLHLHTEGNLFPIICWEGKKH